MNHLTVHATVRRTTRRPAFVWDRPRVMMEALERRRLYASSLDSPGFGEFFDFTLPLADGGVALLGAMHEPTPATGMQRPEKAAIIRLDDQLNPVTTFGDRGTIFLPESYGIYSGIQTSDGSLLVGGFSFTSESHIELFKIRPDGSLDTTFDHDGRLTLSVPGYAGPLQIVELADGDFVISTSNSSSAAVRVDDVHLFKLNPDGSRDTAFDSDGQLIIDRSVPRAWNADFARGLLALSDGRFVVAITTENRFDGQTRYETTTDLICYNPDGTVDTSFGTGGVTRLSQQDISWSSLTWLARGGDDSIVVLHYVPGTGSPPSGVVELRRFNSQGRLDTRFGDNGKVVTETVLPDSSDQRSSFPSAMRVAGEQIVIASTTYAPQIPGDPSRLTAPATALARVDRFDLATGALLEQRDLQATADKPSGIYGSSRIGLDGAGDVIGLIPVTDFVFTDADIKAWEQSVKERTGMPAWFHEQMSQMRTVVTRFGEDASQPTRFTLPPLYDGPAEETPVTPADPNGVVDLPAEPVDEPHTFEPLPGGTPIEVPIEAGPPVSIGQPLDRGEAPVVSIDRFFDDDDDLLDRVDRDVLN